MGELSRHEGWVDRGLFGKAEGSAWPECGKRGVGRRVRRDTGDQHVQWDVDARRGAWT